MLYSDMTVWELKDMIKNTWDWMKVRDRRIAKYLTDDKFIGDWIDRHIAKAPQQMELSGIDGEAIKTDSTMIVEIVTTSSSILTNE